MRSPATTRFLALACAVAALCAATALGATGAGAATPTPTTAAQACAGHVSIKADLTGSDLAFIQRFLPCVLTRLTGVKPVVKSKLSAVAARDLKTLEATSTKRLDATVEQLDNQIGTEYCGKQVAGSALAVDSTPPPALTPLLLAENFSGAQAIAYERAKGTVFGFAYARHVIAHDGNTRNPVALVALAVNCNTKPVKLK